MKKCCTCIPLRVGCLIGSIILMVCDLIGVPRQSTGRCCDTVFGTLFALNQLLNIFYLLGCLSLFASCFVLQSVLVKTFLASSVPSCLLRPLFLVRQYRLWWTNPDEMIIASFGLCCCIYIWTVAVYFQRECSEYRREQLESRSTNRTFRKETLAVLSN